MLLFVVRCSFPLPSFARTDRMFRFVFIQFFRVIFISLFFFSVQSEGRAMEESGKNGWRNESVPYMWWDLFDRNYDDRKMSPFVVAPPFGDLFHFTFPLDCQLSSLHVYSAIRIKLHLLILVDCTMSTTYGFLSCVCNRNQVHFPRRILQPSCVAFINTVDIVELAVCTAWERKPKFLSACRCNLCKVCTVRTCMGGPFFLSIFIVNSRSSSLSTLFWLCLFLSGHSN